jgi:hypothetical protein
MVTTAVHLKSRSFARKILLSLLQKTALQELAEASERSNPEKKLLLTALGLRQSKLTTSSGSSLLENLGIRKDTEWAT